MRSVVALVLGLLSPIGLAWVWSTEGWVVPGTALVLMLAPPVPALLLAIWGLRRGENRRLALSAVVLSAGMTASLATMLFGAVLQQ